MPPRLVPPIPEIAKFATPLNAGERLVLDRLIEVLDDRWTVYVQPHVLNLHPDFILLSDQHGITVLEVKDWVEGGHRLDTSGMLTVRDHQGHWHQTDDDPVAQAHRYRRELNDRVASPPGEDLFSSVRASVILPRWSSEDASMLLRSTTRVDTSDHQWIRIVGKEFLDPKESSDTWSVAVLGGTRMGRGLTQRASQRIRARLGEHEAVMEQRTPLRLSQAARNVASNPSGATIRRIRGSAGSGKTLGLAARAATLARDGKDVLVVSYNITLAHYVQDLVRRHARQINADHRRVDCIHFHGFCRQVVSMGAKKRHLPEEDRDEQVRQLFLAAQQTYVDSPATQRRYDAILVDEGQDFEQQWWNFLRNHVRRNQQGEMILAADVAQDIYEKRSWIDESSMPGCGFSGPWTELEGSYRLPVDFSPILAEFVEHFLPKDAARPTVPIDHYGVASEPTVRRWINLTTTDPTSISAAVRSEVERVLNHDTPPHHADVTILVESHSIGLQVVDELPEIEHIFALEKLEQKRRKDRFWPGVSMMKASTVYSFKGWESRAVIIVVGPGKWSERAAKLAYVAMSRVKGDPSNRSAFVTVVNCIRDLDGFQTRFEREVTMQEAPGLGGDRQLPI